MDAPEEPNGWPRQAAKPPTTASTQQLATAAYRGSAQHCWKLILAILVSLTPFQALAFYRMVKDIPQNRGCDSLIHARLERIKLLRDSFRL